MSTTTRTSSRLATKRRKLNAQKKSSKHYDDEGDVEIVSSDNVLFKLPAFRLQASSSVFRDMIRNGLGGYRNKFELRDPEIETAKILECVFDIIVSNKAFLDFRSVHYQYIIEFMQKYDFERDMEHLRTSLQLAVAERRHLIRAIVAASHLGDIKLCGRIIATAENLVWSISNAREASFGSALQARPLFDIRSWPIEQMESLRPSFFWVLLRASEKRTGLEGRGKEDGKAMSAEFLRLMSLEGAPKFT